MEQEQLNLAKELLQKQFGKEWKEIVQLFGTEELTHCVGQDLTSFMAFPKRMQGGKNTWRGNCSPEVVRKITEYVLRCLPNRKREDFLLLDPMCGSGTSGDVAKRIGVQAVQYDLNPTLTCGVGGWNALEDEVEDQSDLVFFHPPYHRIIPYSGNVWGNKPHPDDLSRCENYEDFIEKVNFILKKLFFSLRNGGFLALLVGDIRQKGEFHSIANDVMTIGTMKSWIVKGQFNCTSSQRNYSSRQPFIPIVTEHLLLFQKEDIFTIPFSFRRGGVFAPLKQDSVALSWFQLICMVMEGNGGTADFTELYGYLEKHPKAKNNRYYKERIRACIYEHRKYFIPVKRGCYQLNYKVKGDAYEGHR